MTSFFLVQIEEYQESLRIYVRVRSDSRGLQHPNLTENVFEVVKILPTFSSPSSWLKSHFSRVSNRQLVQRAVIKQEKTESTSISPTEIH